MKKILIANLFLATLIIIGCSKKNNIVNKQDYDAFINPAFHKVQLKNNETDLQFWNNKLKQDTGSFGNKLQVGINALAHFKLTGNVNDLGKADSLFFAVAQKLNNKDASVFLSLAQNAITQHKFKNAEQYVLTAEKIGADAATINMLKFDVSMELGNYLGAEQSLKNVLIRENNFDYLIRKAKFDDYKGEADSSITNMERALALLKNSNKNSAKIWLTTNLADMYSHSGRLKDAYNMYVKSLQLDSANLYALKGIAQICFVEDRNTEEAERIFKFILSTTDAPDLNLNLAEIADFKNDEIAKTKYLNTFLNKIESNKKYGNMYNKYLVDIYLNDKADIAKGLEIATSEMDNRKTPETYSWLALANYKANKLDVATDIIGANVLNKTHEPLALYAASVILQKTNKNLAEKLKAECKTSAYELGPIKYNRLLKGI